MGRSPFRGRSLPLLNDEVSHRVHLCHLVSSTSAEIWAVGGPIAFLSAVLVTSTVYLKASAEFTPLSLRVRSRFRSRFGLECKALLLSKAQMDFLNS